MTRLAGMVYRLIADWATLTVQTFDAIAYNVEQVTGQEVPAWIWDVPNPAKVPMTWEEVDQ
jgi:hypothetical protein